MEQSNSLIRGMNAVGGVRRERGSIMRDDFFNQLPEDIRETINAMNPAFQSEHDLRRFAQDLLRRQ